MIYALLLALSVSVQAQEVSTDTAPGMTLFDDISVANQGKALFNLQSGKPKITGQPRFLKGICFDAAGTNCMTTAPTATTVNAYVRVSSGTAAATATTVRMDATLAVKVGYRVQFNLSSASDANWTLTCNGDTGANYAYALGTVNATPASNNAGSGASSANVALTVTNETTKANTAVVGDLFLMTDYADTKKITMTGKIARRGSGASVLIYDESLSMVYSGASAVTFCTVAASAGNITGWWSIQQLVD